MIAEILTKKPFARVTPEGYLQGRITSDLRNASFTNNSDRLTWQLISQADFIREFYPSGHKINCNLSINVRTMTKARIDNTGYFTTHNS
jgi:hypothetical protein